MALKSTSWHFPRGRGAESFVTRDVDVAYLWDAMLMSAYESRDLRMVWDRDDNEVLVVIRTRADGSVMILREFWDDDAE